MFGLILFFKDLRWNLASTVPAQKKGNLFFGVSLKDFGFLDFRFHG